MGYVITNGTDYITKQNRKYVKIKSQKEAFEFQTKDAALNIFNNQITKKDRSSMFLREIVTKQDTITTPLPGKVVKVPTVEKHFSNSELRTSESINDWVHKLKDLNGITEEAQARELVLASKLSNIDRSISDVHHYIEGSNFNVCNGYKAYKMLQNLLIERRQIKNEQIFVKYIISNKLSNNIDSEIKKVITKIQNKEYEPKVLNELFNK